MSKHQLRKPTINGGFRATVSEDNGTKIRQDKTPLTVAVIYGGPSVEHDVSLWSAKNIAQACRDAGYKIVNIYVSREGIWRFAGTEEPEAVDDNELYIVPATGLLLKDEQLKIDVAFPIIHGTFGEDGTLQAILESLRIPYIGCEVAASAIAMDKVFTKRLAASAGIPIAKFLTATKANIPDVQMIVEDLGLPLFVKPASLGSSVGVSKVKTIDEIASAIEQVFAVDDQVLIEEMIEGREIECSFLQDGDIRVSRCGEISTTNEFYSYNAKYLDEASVKIEVPAQITVEAEKQIQSFVRLLVDLIGLRGFARIDFFLTKDGRVVLNEINTIPGFTKFSMYPRLWVEQGYSSVQLIQALIMNA